VLLGPSALAQESPAAEGVAGDAAAEDVAAEAPEVETEAEAPADDTEARLQQAEQDGDARLHYQLAVRALRRGEFEEAAGHFDEAYELSHRPEMLYNSYLAWRDAQNHVRAIGSLRAYLDRDDELPDRARLRAVLANMEAEQAQASVVAEPRPAAPAPAEEPPPPAEPAGPPTGALVLTGLGAAALVAAAITGGVALSTAGELESACPADRCTTDESSRVDALRTVSLVTDVLWPFGVALAVSGVIWLAVELSSSSSDVAQAPRVDLALGLGQAQLRGSF